MWPLQAQERGWWGGGVTPRGGRAGKGPCDGQLSRRVTGTEVGLCRAAREARRPPGETQGEQVTSPRDRLSFVRLKIPRLFLTSILMLLRDDLSVECVRESVVPWTPFLSPYGQPSRAWEGQGEECDLPSPSGWDLLGLPQGTGVQDTRAPWAGLGPLAGTWGSNPMHLLAEALSGLCARQARGSNVCLCVKLCGGSGRVEVGEFGAAGSGPVYPPLPPCSGAWAASGLKALWCAGPWREVCQEQSPVCTPPLRGPL